MFGAFTDNLSSLKEKATKAAGNIDTRGLSDALNGIAVTAKVKAFGAREKCSQCEEESKVQCVCCDRYYCSTHQALDDVSGIIRTKSSDQGMHAIPNELKTEKYVMKIDLFGWVLLYTDVVIFHIKWCTRKP